MTRIARKQSPKSFGKCEKDAAWSRVMRAQCCLKPSAARIGTAMSLLAVAGFLLALDAKTLAFSEGYQGLWILPHMMEGMLTSIPPSIGAALLIIVMLMCFQTIVRLVFVFRTDDPYIMADYHGLVVRTGNGPAGFSWTDIVRAHDLNLVLLLRLREHSFVKTNPDIVWKSNNIWVPTLFLEGGAQALMNAIAHVRPDLVRHWWPDADLDGQVEREEELAMVGFGATVPSQEVASKLQIRGKSVASWKR
jgi:hypothetical protein